MSKCTICDSKDVENMGRIGKKNFSVTSDVKLCNHNFEIYLCNQCGHFQKFFSESEKRFIDELYENYEPHYLSNGNEPVVFFNDGSTLSRSYYIFEKCLPYITKPNGKLLDIGSGNGTAIKSAQKLLKNWRFSAFDVSDIHKDCILAIPGVDDFFPKDLSKIECHDFDVITMWHSIEHISNAKEVLLNINGLLNENGLLLIQVPDIIRSPFDFSVIDHCSHFSNEALKRLLLLSGFEILADGYNWVYNCLTLVAQKKSFGHQHSFENNFRLNFSPQKHINYLNDILEFLDKKTLGEKYMLFGTGIASMCIFAQISTAPIFFIDEDKSKTGKTINCIKIIDYESVPDDSTIVLPFIKNAATALIEKLNKTRSPKMNYIYVDF